MSGPDVLRFCLHPVAACASTIQAPRGVTMMTTFVFLLASAAVAERRSPSGPWSPRSLSCYVRARSGLWRGSGRLINTLTGARIAHVEFLEEVTPPGTSRAEDAFGSRRALVYKAADGSLLGDVVRYDHNVSIELADGNLLLRAAGPGGDPVASGWGVGRGPLRVGLRRSYEVSVRPLAKGAAADTPVPAAEPQGWPRTAKRDALGTTREDYQLLDAVRPGGRRGLLYKRTGRCPTWYGAGVCTLEVEASAAQPQRLRFWRRRRADTQGANGINDDDVWERQVRALAEAN